MVAVIGDIDALKYQLRFLNCLMMHREWGIFSRMPVALVAEKCGLQLGTLAACYLDYRQCLNVLCMLHKLGYDFNPEFRRFLKTQSSRQNTAKCRSCCIVQEVAADVPPKRSFKCALSTIFSSMDLFFREISHRLLELATPILHARIKSQFVPAYFPG